MIKKFEAFCFCAVAKAFYSISLVLVGGCVQGGGTGAGHNDGRPEFSLGVTVSGLEGSGLRLANGDDVINVAQDGAYEFPTGLHSGETFNVTVATHPKNPAQICDIESGSGEVGDANIDNVVVKCRSAYALSIEVSGWAGPADGAGHLDIKVGDEILAATGNGRFRFQRGFHTGESYELVIDNQPKVPSQICTLDTTKSLGEFVDQDVVVPVTCAIEKFRILAHISGLRGAGLVLVNNGTDELNAILQNGDVPFSTLLDSGARYHVEVKAVPNKPVQQCVADNGPDPIVRDRLVRVNVVCETVKFKVGGKVNGLDPGESVTLLLNQTSVVVSGASPDHTFGVPIESGAYSSVVVNRQPTNQLCKVADPNYRTVGDADITDMVVNCWYQVRGGVTHLSGSGLTIAVDGGKANGGSEAVVSTNYPTFALSPVFTGTHTLSFAAQPASPWQTCAFVDGGNTNLTTLSVSNATNSPTVSIDCKVNSYEVTASVAGLFAGNQVSVQVTQDDNGAAFSVDYAMTQDGVYTLREAGATTPLTLESGRKYRATLVSSPTTQKCFIAPGTEAATVRGRTVDIRVRCPRLEIFAGDMGGPGYIDGVANAARFFSPGGIVTDASGNFYVLDAHNYVIRKVTKGGVVSTFAVLADRTNIYTSAYYSPAGIAIDSKGNLYESDLHNNAINKITPDGAVALFAGSPGPSGSTDGTGNSARFNGPYSLVVDANDNIYVSDSGNYTVRKITPAGVVTTVAGKVGLSGSVDGVGDAARFGYLAGIVADASGNVYVADLGNSTIRKIASNGVVTTVAGSAQNPGSADGNGTSAQFDEPIGLALDAQGNLYVTDLFNDNIRKISPNGMVTTLAGTARQYGYADGIGSAAKFYRPSGVVADTLGSVYIADSGNNVIRKITTADGVVSTFVGKAALTGVTDGTGSNARFHEPDGITTATDGTVYVADSVSGLIRAITPSGAVTTLAGVPYQQGYADGTGSAARFSHPQGIVVDRGGNLVVADTGINAIRQVTPSGVVTTIAGTALTQGGTDGVGSDARFNAPIAVAADIRGNFYVADSGNRTIRKIAPGRVVTTLAGAAGTRGSTDGVGSAARFYEPRGVAVDSSGAIYEADYFNHTIRTITPDGVVTTFAGKAETSGAVDGIGGNARFSYPQGVATDAGDNVYVADSGNHTIRKITPEGVVSTVVGSTASSGFLPGDLPGALYRPRGMAIIGTTMYITLNNGVAVVYGVP